MLSKLTELGGFCGKSIRLCAHGPSNASDSDSLTGNPAGRASCDARVGSWTHDTRQDLALRS